MRTVFILALCLSVCSAAPLWGPVGHEVTASIAAALISSNVASTVSNILGGASMSSVSTWADDVKHEKAYAWSEPLHFINTPDWACDYDASTDCVSNICVAGAIANYSQRVVNSTLPTEQVFEALKFLIHFVGDIHQPLHVAFASDRGGNDIKGTFFGYNDNLHAIWDTYIIKNRMNNHFSGSQSDYLNYLVKQIQGPWAQQAKEWAECASGSPPCETEWAGETAGQACKYAYVDSSGNRIESGFDLGQDYQDFTAPIVDEQLSKGGVRLAATLNSILANDSAHRKTVLAMLQRMVRR